MKILIILSTLLAVAFALPYYPSVAFARSGFIIPGPAGIRSQFHAQDELGQYSYGYTDQLSSKQEVKSLDGTTRGSYSYVDAEGKLQTVDYAADDLHGFRVAATNLPKAVENKLPVAPEPVVDTPEVTRAKEEHLAAFNEAKIRVTPESVVLKTVETVNELPKPVEDTPEVVKARAEHLAAKKEIEFRDATTIPAINTIQYASVPFLPFLKTTEFPHQFAYSVNGPFIADSRYLTAPVVL